MSIHFIQKDYTSLLSSERRPLRWCHTCAIREPRWPCTHWGSLGATECTPLDMHLERFQLIGFLIWLLSNAASSRTLPALLCIVLSSLGIICSFTHFDIAVYTDLDNFRGRALGTHYGCLKKSTVQWCVMLWDSNNRRRCQRRWLFFSCLKRPHQ